MDQKKAKEQAKLQTPNYSKFKEEATRPYVTNWDRRMASSKFLSYESTSTTERGR
jgi:hypothetical protein